MNFSDLSLINVQNPLVVSNGLVGYWSFNDGSGVVARDFSGNKNDGNIVAATWGAGNVGPCLNFNASVSSFVNCPSTAFSFQDTSNFSVVFWMKSQTLFTDTTEICATWAYLVQFGWAVRCNPAAATSASIGLILANTSGGGRQSWAFTPAMSSSWGKWAHVAIVHPASAASTDFKYYVDGVSLTAISLTNAAPGTLATVGLNIGKMAGGAPQHHTGPIDDLRIYNRAITAAEVNQLYLARGT